MNKESSPAKSNRLVRNNFFHFLEIRIFRLFGQKNKKGHLIRKNPKRNNKLIKKITATSQISPNDRPTVEKDKLYFRVSLLSISILLVGIVFPPLRLLSIPTQIYTVYPFVIKGFQEIISKRRVTMAVIDMIVLPGVLLAGYLFTSATAITLYYLSKLILKKTEDNSKQKIVDIFGELPKTVWVLIDEQELQIPFEDLQPGDKVVVNAGGMIPVDGLIVDGVCSVDQSMLTGESQPAEKGIGETVFAATMLMAGRIVIEVAHAGAETTAAQIGHILMQTADFKTNIQSRGEAIGDQSAPLTLALGLVALPLLGLQSALAVLYSAMGYNMRIIAPLSMLNYLSLALQSGILVKDARSFEQFKKVDTVVFDKTGTLTLAQPHVGQIYTWHDVSEDILLAYAAAAEYQQDHPIAKAILAETSYRNLKLPNTENARYEMGYGITVVLAETSADDVISGHRNGQTEAQPDTGSSSKCIHVGSQRFMDLVQIDLPEEVYALQTASQNQGHSLVMVAIDGCFSGVIELVPTLRPEAAQIIAQLRARGMTLYVISGDQERPTRTLAETLHIDHYFANTLPEQKAMHIEELQRMDKTVCFIGDGINDTIALKQADISISLSGASTIATDTAQIILMDASLQQVANLFDIADEFERNMKVNLWTTLVPGVLCISGVYFLHFGLAIAIILYNIGLVAGVSNSMLPRLQNIKHT